MAYSDLCDIHGEANRFHAMLEKLRLFDNYTLYILGNVIDLELDGKTPSEDTSNMVIFLGNHEYMMKHYFSQCYWCRYL